ncbi:hypothetical protein O6H91_05G123200 [Diphasiastrum complanatum]|uniref:Uncharacterized protein n=1 Tax=Diphasiastrum complanatum TaxID=34168 RepID=A0ACC2DSQ6_DIPCM|nr:hypothetical protein O6H91_05G123200 [Diphasiastrum complanatum]
MGVPIVALMPLLPPLPSLLRQLPSDASLNFHNFKSAFTACSSAGEPFALRGNGEDSCSKRLVRELCFLKPVKAMSSHVCNCKGHLFDDFKEDSMRKILEERRIPFQELGDGRELRSSARPSEFRLKVQTNSRDQIHRNISRSKLPELSDDGGLISSSLKSLKRQHSLKRKEMEGNRKISSDSSMTKALSSLLFILNTIQSHALEIRKVLLDEDDVRGVLAMMRKEMHSSFLWLFQQIFARTPELMISIMILLANYTACSMDNTLAIAAIPPSMRLSILKHDRGNGDIDLCSVPADEGINIGPPNKTSIHTGDAGGTFGRKLESGSGDGKEIAVAPRVDAHGDVDLIFSDNERAVFLEPSIGSRICLLGHSAYKVGIRGMNHDAININSLENTLFVMPDNERHMGFALGNFFRSETHLQTDHRNKANRLVAESQASVEILMLQCLFKEAVNELERRSKQVLHCVNLDQVTIRSLVAPVRTELKPDDYECYERTDHCTSMRSGLIATIRCFFPTMLNFSMWSSMTMTDQSSFSCKLYRQIRQMQKSSIVLQVSFG